MFCPHCRADVAAELSTDNRRLLCARCSTELGLAAGLARPGSIPRRSAEIQHEARDLLARWKADRPTIGQIEEHPPAASDPGPVQDVPSPREDANVTRRFDKSHAGQSLQRSLPDQVARPENNPAEPAAASADARESRLRRRRRRRFQERSTGSGTAVPHQTALPAPPPRTNGIVLAGQLTSYGGIGLSTCGTALVLWAYFGGPEACAPAGWLLTTFGQMTLFAGVVMLITGGMEQTQREVVHRIEQLGDRLLRMEFAHGPHVLKGPHFAEHTAAKDLSSKEVAEYDAPVATD